MALVFQYGSNTSEGRLNSKNRLQGEARKIGIARTVGLFELDFTVWSNGNDCAASDITPNGTQRIWGVLYEIPDHRVFRDQQRNGTRTLDHVEGSNYERVKIKIEDENGQEIEAWTYTVLPEKRKNDIRTSEEYVSHIINGLSESGVPQEYITYVKERARANNPELTFPKP